MIARKSQRFVLKYKKRQDLKQQIKSTTYLEENSVIREITKITTRQFSCSTT
jgi:hypothetical protein